MNPILDIEGAIVARLKSRLPGRVARVEPFPDKPSQFDFSDREGAVVLVHYAGADYSPTGDTPRQAYSPRRTMKWQIVLLVRSLRGAEGGRIGAYDVLDEVRRAVQGVSFAGATPMAPRREILDEEKDGVWRWTMEFSASIPALAEAQHEHGSSIYSQPREDGA